MKKKQLKKWDWEANKEIRSPNWGEASILREGQERELRSPPSMLKDDFFQCSCGTLQLRTFLFSINTKANALQGYLGYFSE